MTTRDRHDFQNQRSLSDRHAGLDPASRKKPMNRQPAVYMLASKRNGTLYIGVTSDLIKRIWEHKSNVVKGFTDRYNVHQLVWYELHETMEAAIRKEKMLKNWKRSWKLELIESSNPDWQDLYESIV
jgi:putative endonuclease